MTHAYLIRVSGCDDVTEVELTLTDDQALAVRTVAALISFTSTSTIMTCKRKGGRAMTARMGSALPKGDANGLGVITTDLIQHPHRYHVVLAIVDCKSITTDNDTGEVVPTARVRRIEVVDPADLKTAEKLIRRALERRSGTTVLPLELEDELTAAFANVDPRTGEVLDGGDGGGP